jgi:type II secretory pathway component PulF
MTDERQQRVLNPHLRTRPATMVTAIGLCMIIMLIQLVPDLQDLSSRFTTTSSASTTAAR